MKALRVGVTGNAGSCKTTVTGFFAQFGAQVIDADQVGHTVLEMEDIKRSLIDLFGTEIISSDGRVNRRAIAHAVFGDPVKRKKFEALVKPRLLFLVDKAVERLAAGGSIIVVDGALIYEFGVEDKFDAVVAITSDRDVLVGRLKERKGYDDWLCDAVLDSQMPQEEKAARADFTIVNDGTLDDLRGKALEVFNEIKRTVA